jgi:uncharacterized protein
MLENQLFLIYLLCVMVISKIIKEHELFNPLYTKIANFFKSKKATLFVISCISGILPIPGRVVMSAGILDTLTNNDKKSRSKYGVSDFLSTHHYYWWSPLEKTVIIPMAAFGLTYLEFLRYTIVPLIISLVVAFSYIIFFINEKDVLINKIEHINSKPLILSIFPIILAIVLLCLSIEPYWIFPPILIYYIIYCKEYNIKKLLKYINWQLLALMFFVILMADIFTKYNSEFKQLIEQYSNQHHVNGIYELIVISVIAFIAAFLMGSSAKYASLATIITAIFGIGYLTYFLIIEFVAYILSPFHKCVLISSKYFGTSLKEYYKVLCIWGFILISYGIFTIVSK